MVMLILKVAIPISFFPIAGIVWCIYRCHQACKKDTIETISDEPISIISDMIL
jgi:hypothetical protein